MAIPHKVSVVSFRIAQALPRLLSNPRQDRPGSLVFGSSSSTRYQLFKNSAIANSSIAAGEDFVVGSINGRPGLAGDNYVRELSVELVLEIDGVRGVFYATLDFEHDESDPSAIVDVVTLRESGQAFKTSGSTIVLRGLKNSTSSVLANYASFALSTPTYELVVRVNSSQLGTGDCSDEFVFDPNKCVCQPVCPVDIEALIADCSIEEPADPIRGCIDLPSVLSQSAMILSTSVVGPPGAPGAPGPAGPQGPAGPPGQPGRDGCTPKIIYTEQTVYTTHCGGPPFTMIVTPFPPCNYWIHVIKYVCVRTAYNDSYCCDYIYCDGQWKPVSPAGSPTSTVGDIIYLNQSVAYSVSPGCIPGLLWSIRTAGGGAPSGTLIGPGSISGLPYYAKCSPQRPDPVAAVEWSALPPAALAAYLGESIVSPTASPNCCQPAGGAALEAAQSSGGSSGNPCEDLPPPSHTGHPGEKYTRCKCDGLETTTCSPAGSLWTILLGPSDEYPAGTNSEGCVDVGYTEIDGDRYHFYSCCFVSTPPPPFRPVTAECYALQEGYTFIRLAPDPKCCESVPPCPGVSTTSPATTTSTTTAATTSSPTTVAATTPAGTTLLPPTTGSGTTTSGPTTSTTSSGTTLP